MKRKQKNLIIMFLVILLILFIIMLYKSTHKIVYMEAVNLGIENDEAIPMDNQDFILEQKFQIPYKMFSGVGFMIGTNDRDNNSKYSVIVFDKTENKQIAVFTLNSSEAQDNSVYNLLLENPIKVDNTHTFSVVIKANSFVDGKNNLCFWTDEIEDETLKSGKLHKDGKKLDSDLCMKVYGGSSNTFWFIFTLGCEIYIAVLISYVVYLYVNQKSIKQNSLVQTGVLGIIIFSILTLFINQGIFCDEIDNMVGGMLISKGQVIYRDYYTQHTPFAYFLCAAFAIFKAGSIEQFRLVYYVLMAFIYMGLYLRHKENFGRLRMFLLPIILIVLGIVLGPQSIMILSDNIQAICMVALILEFIEYLKDEQLDWKRSIIVSLAIFISFMSAFVSVYAIFVIVLGVFIKEIMYWLKNKNITFLSIVQRYWRLILSCIIPFVLLFLYFILTYSLTNAYEQAFKFNTEVYSYYIDYGENKIQPIFLGVRNFLQIIQNQVGNIFNGKDISKSCILLLVNIGLFMVFAKMISQKKYLKMIIIILFICFGYTRNSLSNFHDISAWLVTITVVWILFDISIWNQNKGKIFNVVVIFMAILSSYSYINNATNVLFEKKEPVFEIDQFIVQNTVEGDEVFADTFLCETACNPLYLVYKNRNLTNRCAYILPWYMDYYEIDTIEDLDSKKPKFVVYSPEIVVWKKFTNFSQNLKEYIEENYKLMEGYRNCLWIRK